MMKLGYSRRRRGFLEDRVFRIDEPLASLVATWSLSRVATYEGSGAAAPQVLDSGRYIAQPLSRAHALRVETSSYEVRV